MKNPLKYVLVAALGLTIAVGTTGCGGNKASDETTQARTPIPHEDTRTQSE